MKHLVVINPNASQTVTDGIAEAVAPFASLGRPVRCLTLAEGPPGIETQEQVDRTIAPMLALAQAQKDVAGYVIACFGDPGLYALRDQTSVPVVGIQQAGVLTALALGQRFGVLAILPGSIPRHLRSFGAMGVLDRLAGDRAIGRGVAELAKDADTLSAMTATAKKLRDEDGADVLIMGCAGMARFRAPLEDALGLPVVEPCQAAVGMALSLITADLTHDKRSTRNAE